MQVRVTMWREGKEWRSWEKTKPNSNLKKKKNHLIHARDVHEPSSQQSILSVENENVCLSFCLMMN